MAIAREHLLTYERYMAEGEVFRRYDILDGVRVFMTNPNEIHQDILMNIAEHFRDYRRATQAGKETIAPQDVLIRHAPLRTRQPDVLFISPQRRAQNRPPQSPAPLDPAPELVVEILSSSDRRNVLAAKLRDYNSVGVQECWVVRPDREEVEVLRLTGAEMESLATYRRGETVQSLAFPGLTMPVDAVFA